MKCWHPDVFCASLLNAQPMGFYAPAQIVRDAREHGVEVRPVCVNASRWDCTLEPLGDERFAVRLGLRMVRGLANKDGAALVGARGETPFDVGEVIDHVVSPIIYHILFGDREPTLDYCHALLDRVQSLPRKH